MAISEKAWCSETDVQKRFRSIQTGANHKTDDIEEAIEQASNRLKPILVNRYGIDEVDKWTDQKTVPLMLREMVANLAASIVYQNCYRQSVQDELSQAASFYKQYLDDLKRIESGKAQLADVSTGGKVPDKESLVHESTEGRTKTFTKTHPDDEDFGDGSLDGL